MRYQVKKTYGHNEGWSCVFRQPSATSHCREPHGYPLSFEFTFRCEDLNECNWVIDFGSLKGLKAWLKETFDHRLILAHDDPYIGEFRELYAQAGWKAPVIIPHVGCEGFAKYVAGKTIHLLRNGEILQGGKSKGLALHSVEVREHGANAAIYFPPYGEL